MKVGARLKGAQPIGKGLATTYSFVCRMLATRHNNLSMFDAQNGHMLRDFVSDNVNHNHLKLEQPVSLRPNLQWQT